jgi:uncharacterized protein (DUF427 family)
MLREGDCPTLQSLIESGEAFINEYILPRDDAEVEYLQRFAKADYQPALLFADYDDVATAAEFNPEALWKLTNLKKMPAAYAHPGADA